MAQKKEKKVTTPPKKKVATKKKTSTTTTKKVAKPQQEKKLTIVHIASEATPFVKTGGLADVVGSLAKYQVKQGHKCYVIIPKYYDISAQFVNKMVFVKNFDVYMSWRKQYVGVLEYQKDGVNYLFVDNEYYFKRSGIYGYGDDGERFGFFTIAAMEILAHLQLQANVVHAHDWHTAMASVLYHEKYKYFNYYKDIKFILTVHNPAYQGNYDKAILSNIFGLSEDSYQRGATKFNNGISYLKSGIVYSDVITTVSPSHKIELLQGDYAYDLEGILNDRKDSFFGILNGIDYNIFDPSTDPNIENYTDAEGKKRNKKILQEKFNLAQKDVPVLCFISRLTWQKGVELIIGAAEEILKDDIQLILIGNGDYHYEQRLEQIRAKYPDKVGLYVGFNNSLAMQAYAGSDYLLMPSLFEPCGINQMIALRYGTVPIVRECGGLKDSVIAYNEYTKVGNAFSFKWFSKEDFVKIIKYALSFYPQKDIFENIIKQAFNADNEWSKSALEYLKLYR